MRARHDTDGKIYFVQKDDFGESVVWLCEVPISEGDNVAAAFNRYAKKYAAQKLAEAQPETAGRTLAGVAPTTTQGPKSAPEIVEGGICLYCKNDTISNGCRGCERFDSFEGRRLSPVT
jgi:hypothetical protein